MKPFDLTEQRFGRLIAKSWRSVVDKDGGRRRLWSCECDCGKRHETEAARLRDGRVKSCGCLRDEVLEANCRGAGRRRHNSKAVEKFVGADDLIVTSGSEKSWRDIGGAVAALSNAWRRP